MIGPAVRRRNKLAIPGIIMIGRPRYMKTAILTISVMRMPPKSKIILGMNELKTLPRSSSLSVKGVQSNGSSVFCSRSPTSALAEIRPAGIIANIPNIGDIIASIIGRIAGADAGSRKTIESTIKIIIIGPRAAIAIKPYFT